MDRKQGLGSAAAAVFYTTELLEHILKFLPMKDLLLDQRVCVQWRDVIVKSPELQQNLFFQPREATTYWLYTWDESIPDTIRYMISKAAKDSDLAEGECIFPSAELNPLLFSIPRKDLYGTVLAAAQSGFESFEFRFPGTYGQLSKDPEGSWRRMLLSQPPIRDWSYELTFKRGEMKMRTSDIRTPDDTTMHQVMLKLEEEVAERRNSIINSKRHSSINSICFWTAGMLYACPKELKMESVLEEGWEEEVPREANRWVRFAGTARWFRQRRPQRSLQVNTKQYENKRRLRLAMSKEYY